MLSNVNISEEDREDISLLFTFSNGFASFLSQYAFKPFFFSEIGTIVCNSVFTLDRTGLTFHDNKIHRKTNRHFQSL